MKSPHKIPLLLAAIVSLGMSAPAHADESASRWKLSGGFGFGMLHSGYGVNLGAKNGSSLVFGSVGCDGYESLRECDDRYSLGYFRSDLFGQSRKRHSFGLYVGQFDRSDEPENEATRGFGIGYVFFPAGFDEPGATLGLGYELGQTDGRTDHHKIRVQVGFQF